MRCVFILFVFNSFLTASNLREKVNETAAGLSYPSKFQQKKYQITNPAANTTSSGDGIRIISAKDGIQIDSTGDNGINMLMEFISFTRGKTD